MNDITLEWFFQIPGLFITIGVVLILIALLVLIIGSSKAKNKKTEDLALVDDVQESVANQVDYVNVVNPNGINHLDANNNFNNSVGINDAIGVNNIAFNNLNNNSNNVVSDINSLNTNNVGVNNNVNMLNNSNNINGNNFTPINLVNPTNNFNSQVANNVQQMATIGDITPVSYVNNSSQSINDSTNLGELTKPSEEVVSPNPMIMQEDNNVIPPMAQPVTSIPVVPNNMNNQLVNTSNKQDFNDSLGNVGSVIQDNSGLENMAIIQNDDPIFEKTDNLNLSQVGNNVVPQIVDPTSLVTPIDDMEMIEPVKQVGSMDNVEVISPIVTRVDNNMNISQDNVNHDVEEIL